MSDKPAGALTLGGARGNAARKRLQSINFPPMPDREEMDPVLLHVESVNDPMLANASSKTIRSFQPMMWIRFEPQSDFVDFRFNACPESGWQLEENGIETQVVNLSRRTHEPSGSRTRAAFPAAMSRSDRWIEFSNSAVNSNSSSIKSSSHSRI